MAAFGTTRLALLSKSQRKWFKVRKESVFVQGVHLREVMSHHMKETKV